MFKVCEIEEKNFTKKMLWSVGPISMIQVLETECDGSNFLAEKLEYDAEE